MMKYIYKYLPIFMAISISFGLTSCDDDDRTGESLIQPTSPSISINLPPTVPPLMEQDTSFTIEIILSEAQAVDVAVFLQQVGGDMTSGEDYTMPDRVMIPKGETSATADIAILPDEVAEETETLEIQIGSERTANASIEPVNFSLTITNATVDQLDLALSWTTSIFDLGGGEVDPTDAADLIFTIRNISGIGEDIVVDGAGFEEATLGADLPDGQYTLIATVYSVADVGDLGSDFDIGLVLDLHQIGKIDQSVEFPAVLNSGDAECPGYSFTLGTLTKTGDSYSFEETGELDLGYCGLVGTYSVAETGKDDYETSFSVDEYDPFTLVNGNFWDEGLEIAYVLDTESDAVTIEAQEFDFDLDGAEGDGEEETLTVEGTGTYNFEAASMVVDYVIKKENGDVVEANTQTLTMVE